MSTVIIENKNEGNGLISIPFKGKPGALRTKVKEIKLYAGFNSVPVEAWEEVRKLPIIKKYLASGKLAEANVMDVSEPKESATILSLEDFSDAIAPGSEGVQPEPNGHFLITLGESTDKKHLAKENRVFRVKCNGEDAILTAYGKYVNDMGGKANVKVKVSKLENMGAEKYKAIISETYNPDTLDGWMEDIKKDEIRLLVVKQQDRIKNHKGKAK